MYLMPLEIYLLEAKIMPKVNYRNFYFLNMWVGLEFLYEQNLVTNHDEKVHQALKTKIEQWKKYLRFERTK
jgi:hypothetical protein